MLRISVSFAGNANPCASLRARAHVNESNYIAEMKGLCQSQYLAFSVYFFFALSSFAVYISRGISLRTFLRLSLKSQ